MELTNIPKQLRILICEFNSNHRSDFAATLENIPATVLNLLLSKISYKGNDFHEIDLVHERMALINNLYLNESNSIFQYFNKCKCCTHHQINKPITFNFDNSKIDTIIRDSDYYKTVCCICDCSCRNIISYLFEMHFEYSEHVI
jgi:hypothetical protein